MSFMDIGVNDNCYNMRESCGEICVHCGCCDTEHPLMMWCARLSKNAEWLEECKNFDDFSDNADIAEVQRECIKSDIIHYKDEIRKCRNAINEIVAEM